MLTGPLCSPPVGGAPPLLTPPLSAHHLWVARPLSSPTGYTHSLQTCRAPALRLHRLQYHALPSLFPFFSTLLARWRGACARPCAPCTPRPGLPRLARELREDVHRRHQPLRRGGPLWWSWDLGFGVQGLEFRVWGFGVWGLGRRLRRIIYSGLNRVKGLLFRVQGRI